MGTLSKDNGVSGMSDRIEETAAALGDRISSTITGAGERVARAASGATERVSSAAANAKDRMTSVASDAKVRGGDLIESLGTMMKAHPFATIGIGLGVGFVVAKLMSRD